MTVEAAQKIVKAIVREQEGIIGPLALDQANTVSGLKISNNGDSIEIQGNVEEVISQLVRTYESLFGEVSVDACKESVKRILSEIGKQNIPAFLQ
jgi:hypothetical protein